MPRDFIFIRECLEIFDEEKHAILFFNSCYGGGPSPSDATINLLKTKYKDCQNRDLALLHCLRDLGNLKGSARYSEFGAICVHKEFKPSISFSEYDGRETVNRLSSMIHFKQSIVPKFFESHENMTKEQYHSLMDDVESKTQISHIRIPE